ncbi:putative RNA-binding protein associated with RNAse of E/G family [Mesonia hippocampi]|uniref:Putative RNA-binding protein associated with RNAse of E/G family n=1 Tax=Mesonia hippocampi TaxID=1628250 RepID=A0A840EWC9_9FLAO|nr:DUF4442 domain-containing protein [Mesonia hippocampi]MBB4119147.1 putative RNA-binding protein associated with RNAse of E/G family [Mesonia hippocampi]
MKFTPRKVNAYIFFKLPSAWWCGVRLVAITNTRAEVKVRYGFINKNPFKSMYFAVQAMAAELSTGVLVMQEITKKSEKISMLVKENKAEFTKKAKGVITFSCTDVDALREAVNKAVITKQGQTCWLNAVGIDEGGDQVANFSFKWTLKSK